MYSTNSYSIKKPSQGKLPHVQSRFASIAFAALGLVLSVKFIHIVTMETTVSVASSFQELAMITNLTGSTKPKETRQNIVPIPPRSYELQLDLVKPGDFIYFKDVNEWDSAPIVIESHKLIFFTVPKVGCTVWKQLFRRMMGKSKWKAQDGRPIYLPHNPKTNGLKYLYHYDTTTASKMMTSNEWTRAIMVREPKQRFLSAFLDKAISNDQMHIIGHCCPDRSCAEEALTIEGFIQVCERCDDSHWRPQHKRMEAKYWPYIDEVLYLENAAEDTRRLLKRINAWDKYGKSGWGANGNTSIFKTKDVKGAGTHVTWSQWAVWQWYTPEIEAKVESLFRMDYENPKFNFTQGSCFTCVQEKAKPSS